MFWPDYYNHVMEIAKMVPEVFSPDCKASSPVAAQTTLGKRVADEKPGGPVEKKRDLEESTVLRPHPITPPELHRVPPDPTQYVNCSLYTPPKSPIQFKRSYMCQRCLNHGKQVKRKNHKLDCVFKDCRCEDCQMVDRRRELNTKLQQLETDTSKESQTAEGRPKATKAERIPNCQRCAQHNQQHRLKDHKRDCPFKDCKCEKCSVVLDRRKLMADQIKLRRQQKKKKEECEHQAEEMIRKQLFLKNRVAFNPFALCQPPSVVDMFRLMQQPSYLNLPYLPSPVTVPCACPPAPCLMDLHHHLRRPLPDPTGIRTRFQALGPPIPTICIE